MRGTQTCARQMELSQLEWCKHTQCRCYAFTLLNWTLIVGWSMAKLVIENGHQNDMCHNEFGISVHIINKARKSYVTIWRERKCFILISYNICIRILIMKHDLQSQPRWDNSQFGPLARVVCKLEVSTIELHIQISRAHLKCHHHTLQV